MWAMTLVEFLPTHLLASVGLACLFGLIRWLGSSFYTTKFYRFRVAVQMPLMVCGFFAGGFVYWMVMPTPNYWTVFPPSAWSMIGGMASGALISWFVWRYYRSEFEGDEDAR